MKEYDVAILGAGTAGLTARAEVAKHTDNYVVIDGGILGTTCARVGCMPSKALLHVADTFHRQHLFAAYGIQTQGPLTLEPGTVLAHVRGLRDRFAGGVVRGMDAWKDRFIPKNARFLDANTLDLGDEKIRARQTIIATGSKPFLPEAWRPFSRFFVDTDFFFEMDTLPRNMAVMGMGPIGLELGQALFRLGVARIAFLRRKAMGGLSDPQLQSYAYDCFSREMDMEIGQVKILGESDQGLSLACNGRSWTVDRVLLALGRRPAVRELGLETLLLDLDERGLPPVDPSTMQVGDLPVFMAGDVNGLRPILHEAADQGRIAGFNAASAASSPPGKVECFRQRTGLRITFSSPNICVAGMSHGELTEKGIDFVTGETGYERQGRAMIMGQDRGRIHIYGSREDGRLLGAELIAPAGEHMAHLLAWAIASGMGADQVLSMPFYHPVLEEALRQALRSIAKQARTPKAQFEFTRCEDGITQ